MLGHSTDVFQELHNSNFLIISVSFWLFLGPPVFQRIVRIFQFFWLGCCGWPGRWLVHALLFLFSFDMLCMLGSYRYFCSYF